MNSAKPGQRVLIIAGQAASLINFRGPLIRAMRTAGHQVFGAAPGARKDEVVAPQLEAMGVVGCEIPLDRTGLNPFSDARSVAALVRLMRRVRPDVVLAYTIKSVIFGLLAAAVARVPRRYALITGVGYAFTGRAVGKRRMVQAGSTALYRLALARATKVFFQNTDDAALFRQKGMLPPDVPVVFINGSGIDLEHFRPAPYPAGPVRFLLIARLLSVKGIREYARAAALILKERSGVEFHLVGGFDSNPDALSPSEVKAWEDDGTLIWHGEVADVRPYIADCHVYVLPSYREGTPRSVLEAMAMARPIVTTDAPGCRETVVEESNGFMVAPKSVEPLKAAMERFLADRSLIERMGRKSRLLAESKFDVRQVNATMLHEAGLA
ncbi:MAG: glycosyltransferase family 4 protein [Sphingomicrobium sp.]